MEGQKLEQKSKSTQTHSYLPQSFVDIVKNGKCSWKYNCPACKKKKEKNSKILLKDNLKFVCPKNSAW